MRAQAQAPQAPQGFGSAAAGVSPLLTPTTTLPGVTQTAQAHTRKMEGPSSKNAFAYSRPTGKGSAA